MEQREGRAENWRNGEKTEERERVMESGKERMRQRKDEWMEKKIRVHEKETMIPIVYLPKRANETMIPYCSQAAH